MAERPGGHGGGATLTGAAARVRAIPEDGREAGGHDEGMNTPGDTSTTPASRRRPAAASLAALAVVILAAAMVGVATAVEQAAHPPTCHGIGFGCTPDPATTAMLVGGIYGLPTVAVVWVASWVGWALTRSWSDPANQVMAWWPVWGLAVGTGVLSVVALATAG